MLNFLCCLKPLAITYFVALLNLQVRRRISLRISAAFLFS
jgi:hypothetical protein